MGNLSNLYISKSYQSLIHLETDNTASSTLVGLQDGLGNSIGISVNTSGSLSISGSFTASLANGYAWVGDGNNRTSLVPTSSFGSVTSAITGSSLITASFSGNTLTFTKGNNTTFGVVIPDVSGSGPTDISALNSFTASQYTINSAIGASTSSLNSFTSSQDTKNSTLATYTGSVDTKFTTIGTQSGSWDNTALNSFTQSQDTKNTTLSGVTASLNTSASLAVYTASFSGNTLTFTKGNSSTFSVVLPDVSGSDISSLNAFTQSQDTKNSTLAIYTASVDTKFNTIGTQSGSWDNTSLNSFTQSVDTKFTAVGNSTASLNAYTQSNDTKWSNLASQSGSWVTSAITASSLITASFSGNTLTFTKGSGTTFNIVLPDVSGSDISSLNAFTQSQDTKNSTLATYTASVDTKFSNIGSQSGSWDNASLNAFTQSQETKNSTLATYTASVDTKFTAVGSSTASLNSYTSSQDTKNSTLSTYTASVDQKFSNIGSQSGSWDNTALNSFTQSVDTKFTAVGVSTASLNSYTASQDTKNSTLATYTGSNDTKWSNLGSQSGSFVTESETGSFARTNVDNNFSVNQTFTSITAVSASFTYLQTTFETSSVIYSSGSNQFGDELSDIQTLSGSVKIQGNLTINGTPVQTSSVDISSLNAFTQSQETKNNTLGSYTASVDTKFVAVGSSTASLNSYTSSQDTKNSTLGSYTASVDTKFSTIGTQSGSWDNTALNSFTQSQETKNSTLATYTGSNDTKWNTLGGQTGSYVTSGITGSSLVTASVSLNTITFTKGDASTFNITVNTGSAVTTDISSLNSFTQSQETKNSTLASYTASVDTKFSTIGTQSGSWDNTSLNSFTQSVDSKFVAVGSSTSSLNAYTQSNDTKWSNLASQSGSWVTSTITGSSLITASFSGNTLTFTKGDASTFGVILPDVSGSDISSLNAFTQSQDTKNSTLATYTGSVDTKFSTIGTQSGSWDNTALNSFTQSVDTKFIAVGESTASLNAYTQSNDTKWSTLGGLTGSYVTSAITGSSLVTASFSGNTLTFTKGDSSTFGVIIPDVSGSDISALNAFTQSQDTKNSTLATYTGSVDTKFVAVGESTSSLNAFTSSQLSINTGYNIFTSSQETKNSTLATYTGSVDTQFVAVGSSTSSLNSATASLFLSASLSLTTASLSGNTITFTKGDNSTFGFQIPDVSGSTIPAGTISGSSQITALGFVSSSVTGSSLVTGSVSGNILTFTKGDSTQFSLTVATGSGGGGTIDTGSLLVTASFNTSTRNITFTKGDATQFNLGGFATTGSNDFIGNQSFSASAATSNVVNLIGSSKMTLGGNTMLYNETAFISMIEADGMNQGGSLQFQVSGGGTTFNCGDVPSGSGNTAIAFENKTRSGSITFTNENNTGQIRLKNYTGSIELQAGSSISISGSSTTIQDVNFIPFSASLNSRILAITGSSTNTGSFMTTGSVSGNVLTFTKGDATTFTLTVATGSGGGATFSNPSVESISGSLLLTANTFNSGSTSVLHLSASAQNQANLVFKNNNNTADTIISGSNNIFVNGDGAAAGFKRYFGTGNVALLGSTAQISASMAFSPQMNGNNIQAQFNFRGPVSASDYQINNNFILGNTNFGSSAANNFEKMRGQFVFTQNLNIGTVTVVANKEIISGSTNIIRNVFGQGNTMNVNSSSVTIGTNNINGSTINNNYFSGSAGNGLVTCNNSFINLSTINFEGQNPSGATNQPAVSSILLGGSTLHLNPSTAPLVGTAVRTAVANSVIWGGSLIVTGSSIGTATQTLGSAFFGRFNAQDGNRSKTGETVFAVGTGTGTGASLKTGFLIDSGSNTFVEGTLNVSGSSTFNGNTTITGSLILSSSNTVELYVIGVSEHTGSIKLAPASQLLFATGSNQQAGTAVLDGGNPGTVTVSNSLVTANSIIMLTKQTNDHPNSRAVNVSAKSAGSFTITSNHNGDTDTVGWFIINNS